MGSHSGNRRIGNLAEDFVARHMIAYGWKLQDQNVRGVGWELDLILTKGETLAFIEVKARRAPVDTAADLQQLITQQKLKALGRGSRAYLTTLPMGSVQWSRLRIDLAIVSGKAGDLRLQYIPGAFSDS